MTDTAKNGGKNAPAKKPELEYPREWSYRIITLHADEACEKRLAEMLLARGIPPASLAPGGESSGGKYLVFQLTARVESRAEMVALCDAIVAIPGVKFVL